MEISSAARRSYDHRLKNSVACSRNSNLFPELAIPKRTTSRWASGVRLSVVTASEFSEDHCATWWQSSKIWRRDVAASQQL